MNNRLDSRGVFPAARGAGRQIGCVFIAFASFLAVPLPSAFAGTVTLNPAADAEMRKFTADNNYGNLTTMVSGELGQRANFEIRRAVLRFDLNGQIPPGAVVNSVTLQVTVVMIPLSPVNSDFGVHRLLQVWDESQVTWNSRLTGASWSAPGASGTEDSAAAPSATVFVTGLGNDTFSSTPNLVADVQTWVNDPSG